MQEKVLRKLFLGFIHIHILHHAKVEPFFGSKMIEELREHGYSIVPEFYTQYFIIWREMVYY